MILNFVKEQAEWSQVTFGLDKDRGPLPSLKHLRLEVDEAIEAYEKDYVGGFQEELADCFLLLIDSARRGEVEFPLLLLTSVLKLQENKNRKWPQPTSDEPVFHIEEE